MPDRWWWRPLPNAPPPHRRPADLTEYERRLGPRLSFDQPVNSIVIGAATLSLPMPDADSQLFNCRAHVKERMGQLLVPQGKEMEHTDELGAGDIGAVAKLKETHAGDVLASKDEPVEIALPDLPVPVMAFAIEPKHKGDEDKVFTALRRLQEEDPTIDVHRDDQTGEQIVAGSAVLAIAMTAVVMLAQRIAAARQVPPPRPLAVDPDDIAVFRQHHLGGGGDAPGDPGVPRGIVPTDKNNIAPRLGIVYAPGDRKLVHHILSYVDTSSVAMNPVIKFTTLFGLLAGRIRVIVLNACHSFALADPIASGNLRPLNTEGWDEEA